MVREFEGGGNPSRLRSIFSRFPIIGRKTSPINEAPAITEALVGSEDSPYGISSEDIKSRLNRRLNDLDKRRKREVIKVRQGETSLSEGFATLVRLKTERIEEGVSAVIAFSELGSNQKSFLEDQIDHALGEAQKELDLFNKTGKEGHQSKYETYSRIAQRLVEETRKRYPLP